MSGRGRRPQRVKTGTVMTAAGDLAKVRHIVFDDRERMIARRRAAAKSFDRRVAHLERRTDRFTAA